MLRFWITGGGTREPIDAVRFVGNRSTGALAVALAREAADRGHDVTLFLARGAEASGESGSWDLRRFETARDLQEQLERAPGAPDAVLHAAAVADYAPLPLAEKVPSGQDEWVLRLRPLPKIADGVRRRHPRALLVLFKLETGVSFEELCHRARGAARRAGADLVFANLLEETGRNHGGWLIALDGVAPPRRVEGRTEVASALVDAVEERVRARAAQQGGSDE